MTEKVYCGDCEYKIDGDWDVHWSGRKEPDRCFKSRAMVDTWNEKVIVYELCASVNKHNDCKLYSPSLEKKISDWWEELWKRK